MSLRSPTTLKVVAVACLILAIGAAVGAWNYQSERRHLSHDLLQQAQTAAVTFTATELLPLRGTRDDLGTAAYTALKQKLQLLHAADPRVRYVYVFRALAPDHVVFLGDSTKLGANDESKPGDVYAEAPRSPGLQTVIADRQPACEGPLRDSFGVWVTGYAPLPRPTGAAALPLDMLGLDVAADEWARQLWFAAARGAGYTWLVLAFPVFVLLSTRRQGQQREAIRNLSEAVEQSHSAILILDLEHRIEYANRGVTHQIGYPRRELIGRDWGEFLGGDDPRATAADVFATIHTGRTWEGEWVNRRQDGTDYPVRGMVTPVKHRDGSLSCFVAIFDDATEVKRKEAELREARDLAEAGDRAKGQFLATMSHEVRTPLNGIVGFTSLLLDTSLSTEQRDYVETIRASGEALIQLTGDILDYARIESGKLKLDPIVCDPRDCLEEALDLHAAKAAEKNLELLHRAADDTPAGIVVDGGRLRQVLVNLVGNAVKFTERGEVEAGVRLIELHRATAATPGPEPAGWAILEFWVRDTGIGIAPEQHARLFKPFTQVDDSSTRRYGGAGLGLAISKNLVQLMGGTIALASTPGQGSTFRFTIRAPVALPDAPDRHLDGLRIGLASPPGPRRRELAALLASWDAEVTEVDAVAALAGAGCDLVLLDVDEKLAAEIAARRGPLEAVPPEKAIALVPISLPGDLRAALRVPFRLLVNRPVHHGALFSLLSGARPAHSGPRVPPAPFGLHVLIVEDNAVNQRLLQRVLGQLGCTHRTVGNGRDALAALRDSAERFDVVLLDLHMPEMDGLAALARLRAGEAGLAARTVWTIALTADVRPEQRALGFATGLNDYLTKPLRLRELEAALKRFRAERPKPTR